MIIKIVKIQTKGITLIALIVTIIVLLILAGVVLNLTIGDRGIFNLAQQAGKNYINVAEYEDEMLNQLTNFSTTITSFQEMLKECEISTNYTLEDLVNNKDGILVKVLSNAKAVDYLLLHPDDYLDAFKNSEIAVPILATTENVKRKIVTNTTWLYGIQNSGNAEKFNEHMKTIPVMTSNTTPSGQIIAMDGYRENEQPYSAFDGDITTGWYNYYYKNAVKPNFDHTITYKFDEEKLIYKISAILSNPSSSASNNRFSIFISPEEEGDNWEEIKKDEWSWAAGHNAEIRNEEILLETPKQVRRIKAYSYCEEAYAICVQYVNEIQAYGI